MNPSDGKSDAEAALPLAGVKVLGVEQYISGPYATMILGDLGAEVIKIERPKTGDPRRVYPPHVEGNGHQASVPFMIYNRNKKSVTVDLHTAEGRELFLQLVDNVDAVVENLKPGTADRLGVGYEACRKKNPRIVYAGISGFGRLDGFRGPYSDDPCFDPVAQAMGGIMEMTGQKDGPPVFPLVGLADLYSGMSAAFGVVLALFSRRQSGVGQFVDIAMYDAIISLIERAVAVYGFTGETLCRGPDKVVPIAAFRTADGFVALTAPSEEMWRRLCTAIDNPELVSDPRFSSQADRPVSFHTEFRPIFEEWAADKSSGQVATLLQSHGLPAGKVQTVPDLFSCPQVKARRMLVEMEIAKLGKKATVARTPWLFSNHPSMPVREPPDLGQHTAEILRTLLGFSDGKIEELARGGVV